MIPFYDQRIPQSESAAHLSLFLPVSFAAKRMLRNEEARLVNSFNTVGLTESFASVSP